MHLVELPLVCRRARFVGQIRAPFVLAPRAVCLSLPDATERLSHGEPTFFIKKRVFAMSSNNHHNDGHVSVRACWPSYRC